MSLYRAPLAALSSFVYQPWSGMVTCRHLGDVDGFRFYWVDPGFPLPISEVAEFEPVELSPELAAQLAAQSPDFAGRLKPLQARRAERLQALNDDYEEAVAGLRARYPDAEASTWGEQLIDARAYAAWQSAGAQGDPPALVFLDQLHAQRLALGVTGTLAELVAAVLSNDAEYRPKLAAMTARRQVAERQIMGSGAPELVEWEWGVPE